MIAWVDCQECGQPVAYERRVKEFNTVDLKQLQREREEFRENRWVEVGTLPSGEPLYLRKYDAAYY